MKGTFDITGRSPGQAPASSMNEAVERFVAGVEPMTTMTVQIPARLKHALKQDALDQKTTVKALLIALIESHYSQASKQ